jgi:hypothetical protein
MLIMRFVSFRDAQLCTQYNAFGIDNLQGVVVCEPFLCIQRHFFIIGIDELDLFAHLHKRLFIEEKSHSRLFL